MKFASLQVHTTSNDNLKFITQSDANLDDYTKVAAPIPSHTRRPAAVDPLIAISVTNAADCADLIHPMTSHLEPSFTKQQHQRTFQ